MTTFETRNNHRTYDADTHRVVPKDAVVLDLDFIRFEPYGLPAVLGALRGGNFGGSELARQIEKQTQTPRIPEPGPWGVVQARTPGGRSSSSWLVRRLDLGQDDWQDGAGDYHAWSDLIDPVLIRPGIEDES